MKDEYDFSKAVRKNPYKDKMKKGYSVTIHYSPGDGVNEKKHYSTEVKNQTDMSTSIDLSSTVAEP